MVGLYFWNMSYKSKYYIAKKIPIVLLNPCYNLFLLINHTLPPHSAEAKALVILLPLIGLTWVFGFIFVENYEVNLTFAIITTILNPPQV